MRDFLERRRVRARQALRRAEAEAEVREIRHNMFAACSGICYAIPFRPQTMSDKELRQAISRYGADYGSDPGT